MAQWVVGHDVYELQTTLLVGCHADVPTIVEMMGPDINRELRVSGKILGVNEYNG